MPKVYSVKIYADRTEWLNEAGERHREDGPAVEYSSGSKYYFRNDKLHRTDGPAIEYSDGTKAYWLNGKRHRTDGPAVEREDGSKAYCLNGISLTKQEWLKQTSQPTCAGKVIEIDGKKYKLTEI